MTVERERQYLLRFDEVNKLITEEYNNGASAEELIKTLTSMLAIAFEEGVDAAWEELEYVQDMGYEVTTDDLLPIIEARYDDGKTFADLIKEYAEIGALGSIQRVAETEYHKAYNAGGLKGASSVFSFPDGDVAAANDVRRGVVKTWVTVGDDKVRELHRYLEGETLPLDEEFYTYDGDHGLCPSGFERAENNVNCRCVLEFSYV